MGKNKSKNVLISRIAERHGWSKADSQERIEAVLDEIARLIVEGESVLITGFGTFRNREMEQRRMRNPKTGEMITVPAHNKVSFRPGVRLKEFMDGDRTMSDDVQVIGKDPKTSRKGE